MATQIVGALMALEAVDETEDIRLYINSPGEADGLQAAKIAPQQLLLYMAVAATWEWWVVAAVLCRGGPAARGPWRAVLRAAQQAGPASPAAAGAVQERKTVVHAEGHTVAGCGQLHSDACTRQETQGC